MTDLMKLADEYVERCMGPRSEQSRSALQSAIEALQEENALLEGTLESRGRNIAALQAENEQFRLLAKANSEALGAALVERDALQAKLDAMSKGEPVAHRAWFDADNGARWLFTLWPEEEKLAVEWEPLYAAPKALPSLTDTYVQQVPDKCDRITWRGRYYHLPIAAPKALAPLSYAEIELARREWLESGDMGTAYHSAVKFAERHHGIGGTP